MLTYSFKKLTAHLTTFLTFLKTANRALFNSKVDFSHFQDFQSCSGYFLHGTWCGVVLTVDNLVVTIDYLV